MGDTEVGGLPPLTVHRAPPPPGAGGTGLRAAARARGGGKPNESCQKGNAPGRCVIDPGAKPETDEQKIERYKQMVRDKHQEAQQSLNDHADPATSAASSQFVRSWTGGWSDTISARMKAAVGMAEGNSYSERVHNADLYNQAFNDVDEEDHPIASKVGDAAGTLAPTPGPEEAVKLYKWARRLKRGERTLKDRGRRGGDNCGC